MKLEQDYQNCRNAQATYLEKERTVNTLQSLTLIRNTLYASATDLIGRFGRLVTDSLEVHKKIGDLHAQKITTLEYANASTGIPPYGLQRQINVDPSRNKMIRPGPFQFLQSRCNVFRQHASDRL